jgi:hypothetical protein
MNDKAAAMGRPADDLGHVLGGGGHRKMKADGKVVIL